MKVVNLVIDHFDGGKQAGEYFNMIYNKNPPTSSGSEMNCRFEHKCS